MKTMDAVHRCGFDRRVTLDVQLPATIHCPCGGEAVLLRPRIEPAQGELFEEQP